MIWKAFSTVLLMMFGISKEAVGQVDNDDTRICVLGAGMAGISAAHKLHHDGYTNLVILEGSDRIGGRVKKAVLGGYTVEEGALWIYGQGSNPVSILSMQFNISTVNTDFDDWIVYNNTGQDVTDDADAVYDTRFGPAYEEASATSKRAREDGRPVFSVRSALIKEGWIPKTILDNAIEYYTYDFEYAVPPEEVSGTISLEDIFAAHGDETMKIVGDPRGFTQMISGFAHEFLEENDPRLHLNEVVLSVEGLPEQVTVRTSMDNYTCDYVVVTFSLGVLQHRQVTFNPPLPEWKQDAIDQFSMNTIEHFYFQFPDKFWDDNEYIIYAGKRRGYYTVWLNLESIYPGSKILQVTLVDAEAKRVAMLSASEIVDEAVSVLRTIYPNATVPTAYHLSRWENDPLFYGAYSTWPPGYTLDTYNGLLAPVGNIYFAGEYAGGIHHAFVPGAFYSGQQTAHELQSCIEDPSTCVQYTPAYGKPEIHGCTYRLAKNYRKSATLDDGSCVFDNCVSQGINNGAQKAFTVLCLMMISLLK